MNKFYFHNIITSMELGEQSTFFDLIENHIYKEENSNFLTEQIITYIGNKRSLLNFIGKGIEIAEKRLNKKKLICADLFSGSGIVSRYLKRYATKLYVNDIEAYSSYINGCYLTNYSQVDINILNEYLEYLKKNILKKWGPGFITELYAPRNDKNIQSGERVFYTNRNATYIDTARKLIDELPNELQRFFLAPLLYEASVHNNTSGVFKGFYKNKKGIGQFGGEGQNALTRILGDIEIKLPVFSAFECEYDISQKESLEAVNSLPEVDLCYMDPPYNQHPYGSNYFMLNIILENKCPENFSKISGIPTNWNRSAYNKEKFAKEKLFTVIRQCSAKFILISYNSEGFIKYNEFIDFLTSLGKVTSLETDYNTFRGSRNLRNRAITVKEFLFLLERN